MYSSAIIETILFISGIIFQSKLALSLVLISKLVELRVCSMAEYVEDNDLQELIKTQLIYLKKYGVFSIFNIQKQIVGFGSIFILMLMTSEYSGYIYYTVFSLLTGYYIAVNVQIWDIVSRVNINSSSDDSD